MSIDNPLPYRSVPPEEHDEVEAKIQEFVAFCNEKKVRTIVLCSNFETRKVNGGENIRGHAFEDKPMSSFFLNIYMHMFHQELMGQAVQIAPPAPPLNSDSNKN